MKGGSSFWGLTSTCGGGLAIGRSNQVLTTRGSRIKITFKKSTGEVIETVEANEGEDIVDVSWEYDLDIEGEPPGRLCLIVGVRRFSDRSSSRRSSR